ncbi:MAG: SDR family oxidoreductase [Planctomycetaceae bacterium]|nr:SDR family oxidoreductase [Planctomycetaceae bacterium]
MDIDERVCIVTGGANGIGRAIAERFVQEGAAQVVVADIDGAAAQKTAAEIGALGVACDVGDEAQLATLIGETFERTGRIDVVVSNAGITASGGVEAPDEDWQRLWQINLMAHVYAARAAVPLMLEQGEGYLLQVASAAGVLTEIGSAPYSVTKHAAVSLAEWLSIQYRRKGLRVSCLCPAGVATDFLDLDDPIHQFLHFSAKTPAEVADSVIEGMRDERFLILPHPEVGEYFQFKGDQYDRWLHNFSKLPEKIARRQRKMAGVVEESQIRNSKSDTNSKLET